MAIRLHINIDHVATLRNARGTVYPDPVEAGRVCLAAGADGITMHLREDRRHIRDDDVRRMRELPRCVLNLESAPTDEMVAIALQVNPDVVTLVPEKREERTTEGGLDVIAGGSDLARRVGTLLDRGIRVSLFIAADPSQITRSVELGVQQVEFHTGEYAHAFERGPGAAQHDYMLLASSAAAATKAGLEVAAGHGLTRDNVGALARIQEIVEFNIGHAVVSDAIFLSLDGAVRAMRDTIDAAQTGGAVRKANEASAPRKDEGLVAGQGSVAGQRGAGVTPR